MLFFLNWECTRLSSKKMWCLCFRRGWSRSLLQWSVETWLSVRPAHRWCGQVTTDALCWHGSWFPSSGDDNVWRCLSEVGIILVRCEIFTFYDQRKRTPNLYEFFFLLLWPFGVYSFIFSATSSPEGWASGVSCAFNTPLSPGVNTARRGWGRPHNRFCFTVFHRPAAPPHVCTYINFVFAVSHSDVVEQRGFIQVHQRAWETQAGQNVTKLSRAADPRCTSHHPSGRELTWRWLSVRLITTFSSM